MGSSTNYHVTRVPTIAGSRRGAVAGLLAGAFGLLGSQAEVAAAKN
jgi:hypothetical protein